MQIDIKNLTMDYGSRRIFENLNLGIPEHCITCLTGPSGCGKTTLLKILAGMEVPIEGSVHPDIEGKVSYLFQETLLLPWLNVLDNVSYLMDHIKNADQKKEWSLELIRRTGLEGFEKYYPHELSGGMARRVSFARVMGKKSSLILMDEPFSSLDWDLKMTMVSLMKDLLSEDNRTVFCITHDMDVAEGFADKIYHFDKLLSKPLPAVQFL